MGLAGFAYSLMQKQGKKLKSTFLTKFSEILLSGVRLFGEPDRCKPGTPGPWEQDVPIRSKNIYRDSSEQ
jgi:hypothetical protein